MTARLILRICILRGYLLRNYLFEGTFFEAASFETTSFVEASFEVASFEASSFEIVSHNASQIAKPSALWFLFGYGRNGMAHNDGAKPCLPGRVDTNAPQKLTHPGNLSGWRRRSPSASGHTARCMHTYRIRRHCGCTNNL